MPHEVLRTAQVATVLGGMSAREKRSYEAAVDALRGEGCGAGGREPLITRRAAAPDQH